MVNRRRNLWENDITKTSKKSVPQVAENFSLERVRLEVKLNSPDSLSRHLRILMTTEDTHNPRNKWMITQQLRIYAANLQAFLFGKKSILFSQKRTHHICPQYSSSTL